MTDFEQMAHEIATGLATRRLLTPDSHFTREEWETLCKLHAHGERTDG